MSDFGNPAPGRKRFCVHMFRRATSPFYYYKFHTIDPKTPCIHVWLGTDNYYCLYGVVVVTVRIRQRVICCFAVHRVHSGEICRFPWRRHIRNTRLECEHNNNNNNFIINIIINAKPVHVCGFLSFDTWFLFFFIFFFPPINLRNTIRRYRKLIASIIRHREPFWNFWNFKQNTL